MTISGISSFQEKMEELKARRAGVFPGRQLNVTILGAGPAGLIRAIESVMDNHRTVVLEKRAVENGVVNGRSNTVALNDRTMPLLQEYGLYQWLLENGKIYSYDKEKRPYLSVRLKDLESAMKAVLHELSPQEEIIRYGITVSEVNEVRAKVGIKLQNDEWIRDIDILVNAEGARSSTNELLQIEREQVLAKVPVIAAIFEDTRPSITGVCSFFSYIGKTIIQTIVSVYYYAIFFFKFIFLGERFSNTGRTIVGSLILKTPHQSYLGCGFSKEHSDELLAMQRKIEEAATELERQDAEAEFHSFAKYWINLSFCKANVLAFLIKVARCFGCNVEDVALETAGRFPLKDFKVIEIGADRARVCQRKMNNSAYLISGDALATVDPTTGLGANTAIQTVEYFKTVMSGMRRNRDLDDLLQAFERDSHWRVQQIHGESRRFRELYRPDTP